MVSTHFPSFGKVLAVAFGENMVFLGAVGEENRRVWPGILHCPFPLGRVHDRRRKRGSLLGTGRNSLVGVRLVTKEVEQREGGPAIPEQGSVPPTRDSSHDPAVSVESPTGMQSHSGPSVRRHRGGRTSLRSVSSHTRAGGSGTVDADS